MQSVWPLISRRACASSLPLGRAPKAPVVLLPMAQAICAAWQIRAERLMVLWDLARNILLNHRIIFDTHQGTNISLQKWHFEDDFPFPKVGYVNSLEGIFWMILTIMYWFHIVEAGRCLRWAARFLKDTTLYCSWALKMLKGNIEDIHRKRLLWAMQLRE